MALLRSIGLDFGRPTLARSPFPRFPQVHLLYGQDWTRPLRLFLTLKLSLSLYHRSRIE